jgi:predicted RNase H-related nuclease YkuK (DUF458 family)
MAGKDGIFISPSKGLVSTKEMISLISSFVKEEPGSFYRLVIGTDSQSKRSNGESETDFVSAVVVHRQGKGARYFWKKTKTNRIPVLREKIYTETQISLALAEEIVPMIRECVKPSRYDLEIHIDVGSLGPTREMIREVVGMVNGNGYTAKTKPESWGASSVADKHT